MGENTSVKRDHDTTNDDVTHANVRDLVPSNVRTTMKMGGLIVGTFSIG